MLSAITLFPLWALLLSVLAYYTPTLTPLARGSPRC
jgi:hypothetical protein